MFKSDHTPEQLKWIEDFKLNFDVVQNVMWPRNNQRNNARHDGASIKIWNSEGGGRNDSRNCGWDQGCDKRDNEGDHGSYQGNRNDRGKSTTCRRVGFDDPDRSPESHDSNGDKSYQDYVDYKLQKDGSSSSSRRGRNEEQEAGGKHKCRCLIFRG